MSAKHRDPEFRKNARIIRQTVKRKHDTGQDVPCWRCGHNIEPEQSYDVGHIDAAGGHGIGNLAPEHRYKIGRCQGNRAAGGRLGAATRNARAARATGMLPW